MTAETTDQLNLGAENARAFALRLRQLENAILDLAARIPPLAREVAELRKIAEGGDA